VSTRAPSHESASAACPDGDVLAVRIFVAADVCLYREALADVLSREPGLEVVGVSGERSEILNQVARDHPVVVLLDPAAAGGFALIRELTAVAAGVKIVALALSGDERDIVAYAEAGVSGFVTRDESVDDLVATIRRAEQGELECSSRVAGALLRRVNSLAAHRASDLSAQPLTPREIEVAQLLDEGLTNNEIAVRLQLELSTVKLHVHHILRKLGVASRSKAVARLRRSGLIARQLST
jgi:two-component system, NarL family, nitrate/nitrite response regulator NarL